MGEAGGRGIGYDQNYMEQKYYWKSYYMQNKHKYPCNSQYTEIKIIILIIISIKFFRFLFSYLYQVIKDQFTFYIYNTFSVLHTEHYTFQILNSVANGW